MAQIYRSVDNATNRCLFPFTGQLVRSLIIFAGMLPETLTPPDAELVERIRDRARFARLETVRLISIAKTGHYASGFSCAEILATLYYGVMRLRRGEPDWPERDRFLFGKGHAAATLYPLLADWDFFPAAELD